MRRPAPAPAVFGSSDRHVSCLFVEVTPATATPETTLSWLRANLLCCLPANHDLAFDIDLDVKAVRCVGQEWWTVESQPTEGPASDARHLWRFDVTDAL